MAIAGLVRGAGRRQTIAAAAAASAYERLVSWPHACASAVRPDRARPVEVRHPGRRPLVRHDLPGRLRPVSFPRRAAGPPAALRDLGWTRRDIEDLLFYGVLGVVIGGRLGYTLFYKPGHYAGHPLEILIVWKGGMSFHGGLLGVIAAMLVVRLPRRRPSSSVADLVAPCVPDRLGLPAAWATSSTVSSGAAPRPVIALGDGLPAARFTRCRATRRSSTSSRWKGLLLVAVLLGLGGTNVARPGMASAAFLVPATECCVSSPNTSANPTTSSACSRSA